MMILLFHINIFKQNSIQKLCLDLGIEARMVTEDKFAKPLGMLAGLPDASQSGKAVPFADEMMVFCHMEPDVLDRFLEEYRRREIAPIPLKAVLTPFNSGWVPGRLCMELKKEQQAFGN